MGNNQDKLHQVKEMLQGEGWHQVLDLLDKFLTRNEREKANKLRQNLPNDAVYQQGKIDGVRELLVGKGSDLDRYLADLAKDENEQITPY